MMRFSHHLRLAAALFALLTLPVAVFAQAPAWQWATSTGPGYGNATAVDAAGNVYVTGNFFGSATFGATTLTAPGPGCYVAKLTAAGVPVWAVSVAAGASNDLALDAAGNLYVTGWFNSAAITIGATTLSHDPFVPGGSRIAETFVAKLSPAGQWQWATRVGGTCEITPRKVQVDGRGNVYLAGSFVSFGFAETVSFGADTLTCAGGYDAFVAKMSPAGTWLWAASAGSFNYDYCTGLALAPNGGVYVSGAFESPTVTFGATTLTSAGSYDVFVARLDSAGAWQWAVRAGGANQDYATAMTLDSRGDLVVTGGVNSPTAGFGPVTLTAANDLFVAKLTAVGVWQWAVGAGGVDGKVGTALVVDSGGNTYVTGEFGDSTATFGSITLPNIGLPVPGPLPASSSDIFVAKLTPGGVWAWAVGVGGVGDVQSHGLALAGNDLIVTGYLRDTTAFGATTLPGDALYGASFLARLSTAPLGLPATTAGPALTLYPNPARETLHLTDAPGTTFQLFDALGRLVRTAPLTNGTATLDVRALPAGVYGVRATGTASSGASSTQRLVIE